MPEQENIQLRSDEVGEILGKTPRWMVRWGISLIFLLLMVFLGVSLLLRYPDTVSGEVVLITRTPPMSLVARSNGEIDFLGVKDKDLVKKGQLLAVLRNPASIEDVLMLEKRVMGLERLATSSPDSLIGASLPTEMQLGELQSAWSAFRVNFNAYLTFIRENYHDSKANNFRRQIQQVSRLKKEAQARKMIMVREFELAEDNYQTSQSLRKQGAISQIELDRAEQAYLEKSRTLQSLQNEIISKDLEVSRLRSSIIDINNDFNRSASGQEVSLSGMLDDLKSQIAAWKEKYTFFAPMDGRVSFFSFWQENQFVFEGSELMSVVPESFDIYGKMQLPGRGVGKIKAGQKVFIDLESFPSSEFGKLPATVNSISLVPKDNAYLVELSLPEHMQSTSQKEIPFRQGLKGLANVITEKKSLFSRLFGKLLELFREG